MILSYKFSTKNITERNTNILHLELQKGQMESFTVKISERPLGVRLCHWKNELTGNYSVVLQEVVMKSHAVHLGLSAGDSIIAINDVSMTKTPSSKVMQIFRQQSIPFKVTFRRETHFDEKEEEEEDEIVFNSPEFNSPSSSSYSLLSDYSSCALPQGLPPFSNFTYVFNMYMAITLRG